MAALTPIVDKPAVVADHVKFESPGLSILLPDLSGLRSLARAAQRAASVRYVFARMLVPALSRAVLSHYRGIGDRRLAATALAVRHYQVDHGGQFPPKLADLVPVYLPKVPIDPLSSGKPLNYRSEGEEPAIWSVGDDGRDDGGSTVPVNPRVTLAPGQRWMTRDAVVFLKPRPRDRSVIEPEAP